MKFFGKWVTLLTLAAIIVPLLNAGPVHAAASTRQIIMGNSIGKAGETVEVPITLKSEGKITALQLQIVYDKEMLEFVEVKRGSGLQSSFSVLSNQENGKLVIGSLGAIIGSGSKEVAVAKFMIKSNTSPGSYEVKLAEASFTDNEAHNLSDQFQVVDGAVAVNNVGLAHVTGVTVSPTALTLTAGEATGMITAAVAPDDATNSQVTWSSSNEQVAEVANGVVTPVGAGTATITATTADGGYTAASAVTVQANGGAGGGGNGGNSAPKVPVQPDKPITDVDVIVNGKAESAGMATTVEENGQSVTTVTLDPQKLADRLAAEPIGALIVIPVNVHADAVITELDGQMIKNMEEQQAVLETRTDTASYTLPAGQINIGSLSGQFGDDVELKDITIRIEIATPAANMLALAEQAAKDGVFTVISPPLNFKITASYGDRTIEVSEFNAYVQRTIAIPDDADSDRMTTAVVINSDGTVRHVPTKLVLNDGKYYAIVNSLTNSTYTVVYHPIAFTDVEAHWAKDAVNDMGSRMVVGGIGHNLFDPDEAITRAEFAAIIVRGLGLMPENSEATFKDVKDEAWYSQAVQTAYAYNLINGFEDGTFRPMDKITREQAMVIMAQAMRITALKAKLETPSAEQLLSPFTDAADAADWAIKGIADSLQAAIVAGRSSSELAPKASITRAEVAVMVQRLLRKSGLI